MIMVRRHDARLPPGIAGDRWVPPACTESAGEDVEATTPPPGISITADVGLMIGGGSSNIRKHHRGNGLDLPRSRSGQALMEFALSEEQRLRRSARLLADQVTIDALRSQSAAASMRLWDSLVELGLLVRNAGGSARVRRARCAVAAEVLGGAAASCRSPAAS
jgi:hypothetical protein